MALSGTHPFMLKGSAAAPEEEAAITKSVRFKRADTPSLTFTPSSTGDQKKWTNAMWIKKSLILSSGEQYFSITSPEHSGEHNNGVVAMYFADGEQLHTYFDTSGSSPYGAINSRLYRDLSGWMHFIWAVDAANGAQRIWVNGVEETASASRNPPNYNYAMNKSGHQMAIGTPAWGVGDGVFDGYIAQFVHLDGQYITDPTEFGQFSETSGEWEPIELTSSSFTYGTNGVLLEFTNTLTIGEDTSGNDNDWTATNLTPEDIVNDTPVSNHAVLNGLDHSGGTTLTEGNLEYDTSGWNEIRGTMGVSSGKWYYEVYVDNFNDSSEAFSVGIAEVDGALQSTYWSASWDNAANGRRYGVNLNGTTVSKIEGGTATTITADIVDGDVISILLDLDSGTTTLKFWVNGADEQTLFSSLAAGTYAIGFNSYTASLILNTGQDPTFAGNDPVGSPATSEFAYTPTSGYNGWSTSNLPTPTIAKPSGYFNTVTYAGNGGTNAITGVGHQPDLLWIKNRSTDNMSHQLFDTVRELMQDGDEEGPPTGPTGLAAGALESDHGGTGDGILRIASLDTDGFTTSSTNYSYTNSSGDDYVAWSWKESATAGFDIITWIGDDNEMNNDAQTVNHSLGVVPELIIAKHTYEGMSNDENWVVFHKDLQSNYFLKLNTTAGEAEYTDSTGAISNVTSSSIDFKNDMGMMESHNLNSGSAYGMNDVSSYVAYVFAGVAGFSSFGTWVGTGSASTARFIYTGFRPAWVMHKEIDTDSYNWPIHDSARDPNNDDSWNHLIADGADDENGSNTAGPDAFADFVSNGFNLNSGSTIHGNGNNKTYIYAAFAEAPFKYANAR